MPRYGPPKRTIKRTVKKLGTAKPSRTVTALTLTDGQTKALQAKGARDESKRRADKHLKQEGPANKVFQRALEQGDLRVSHYMTDESVPGVPVGGWIFGRVKLSRGKVTFVYLGDSVPPRNL